MALTLEQKERAYEQGYRSGLFGGKSDQPYSKVSLAKVWRRGREAGLRQAQRRAEKKAENA